MVPPGFRMASNSLTASESLSRMACVKLLFGTSTSSLMISSARPPVICEKMPFDVTLGAWSARAGPTSNESFEHRWSARGMRH